jgi:hypothetical protein
MRYPGKAVGLDFDSDHHVQPENREVIEVVFIERLGAEMGVHATEPLQTPDPLADAGQGWDLQTPGVTHHDRCDGAVAVNQQPDLAFDFV